MGTSRSSRSTNERRPMKTAEELRARYYAGVITASEYAREVLVSLSVENAVTVLDALPIEVRETLAEYVRGFRPELRQYSIGGEALPSSEQVQLARKWLDRGSGKGSGTE